MDDMAHNFEPGNLASGDKKSLHVIRLRVKRRSCNDQDYEIA